MDLHKGKGHLRKVKSEVLCSWYANISRDAHFFA